MFSSIHYREETQLAQRVDKINAHSKNNEKKKPLQDSTHL